MIASEISAAISMDSFLPLLSFTYLLVTAAAASHATLPAQVYWNTVLPNTPMPSAIRDLLRTTEALAEDKTAVNVGKGGVYVNSGHKPSKPGTTVGVGKGGVNVNTGYKGKPVFVNVHPSYSPFSYTYAADDTQIHDDPRVTLFFLESDLRPGAKMSLHFTSGAGEAAGAPLISRGVADSTPFASSKLPQILERFSVDPNSEEAKAMRKTLKRCEEPTAEGERKACPTSLEAMIDFTTSSLGTTEVSALSTEVKSKDGGEAKEYTVGPKGAVRVGGAGDVAVCHLEDYAYAVFYCHTARDSKAYQLALRAGGEGEETAVEAVAVCHGDTAKWNPGHVAFKVLKVKPGAATVCHFMPQDHVLWASKK